MVDLDSRYPRWFAKAHINSCVVWHESKRRELSHMPALTSNWGIASSFLFAPDEDSIRFEVEKHLICVWPKSKVSGLSSMCVHHLQHTALPELSYSDTWRREHLCCADCPWCGKEVFCFMLSALFRESGHIACTQETLPLRGLLTQIKVWPAFPKGVWTRLASTNDSLDFRGQRHAWCKALLLWSRDQLISWWPLCIRWHWHLSWMSFPHDGHCHHPSTSVYGDCVGESDRIHIIINPTYA